MLDLFSYFLATDSGLFASFFKMDLFGQVGVGLDT